MPRWSQRRAGRRRDRQTGSSRLRRSLALSVAEGVIAELVGACASGAVLTAWALYLALPAPLVGLLAALPFAAQALQLPGAWVSALFGNRRAALWTVGLSRQAPLLLVALPFAPLPLPARQWALLAVAGLSAGLAVAGNNAWTSWMGELVPARVRGTYFGRRSGFCALGAAIGGLAAGLALDRGGGRGAIAGSLQAGRVLALLSVAGCSFGAWTSFLLARQHAPADRRDTPRTPRLADALAPLHNARARRLLAFQAAWGASSGLAAAFYPLHMVLVLHMGFTQVALYSAALACARMFAAPLWGRAIDTRGARPVLTACAFGLCVSPLLWLFPRPGLLWPLALDALLCGALQAGQSLSSFSLSLSVARPAQRSFHLAAFATAGGLSTGLGALAGGLAIRALPAHATLAGLALWPAQLLFLLGGAGRLGAALLSLRLADRARAFTAVLASAPPVRTLHPCPAPPPPLHPSTTVNAAAPAAPTRRPTGARSTSTMSR